MEIVRTMSIEIRNATVRDQTIRLDRSDLIHCIMDSTLVGCRVEFRASGRYVDIFRTTFVNCTIVASPKLTAYQFDGARFDRCIFEGTFRNCDFGARPEETSRFGSVQECSFARAKLDRCAFFGASVATLEWPTWPHIVVLDPLLNLADWDATPFPPSADLQLGYIDSDEWPAGKAMRAMVYHLPSQGKTGDPEEIWSLVQDKPYVTFPGKTAKPRASAEVVASVREANTLKIQAVQEQDEALRGWGGLYFARLQDVVSYAAGVCCLRFDTSYLLKRVPDAPSAVNVTFACEVPAFAAIQKFIKAVEAGKFIVRAVDNDGGGLSMRGQRKSMGVLKIPTARATFTTSDGSALNQESFGEFLERYWNAGA